MSGPREQFATVAEHVAAWKAGGRRWARVAGFNVDAWQADEEAKRREAARPGPALIAATRVMVEADPVEARFDADAAMLCPTCGAVRR